MVAMGSMGAMGPMLWEWPSGCLPSTIYSSIRLSIYSSSPADVRGHQSHWSGYHEVLTTFDEVMSSLNHFPNPSWLL